MIDLIVAMSVAPMVAAANALDVQATFWRGIVPRREAKIIPFPKRRRRFRSGNRQFARDIINAAIDEC